MLKLLSAFASLAAIILFVTVAVASPATAAFVGGYGILFSGVLLPALIAGAAFQGGGLREPKAWLLLFLAATFPVGLIVRAITRSDGYSAKFFEGFHGFQALGVLGLILTTAFVVWVTFRWYEDFYRPCPFCRSTIPREATRCRHCTAEVAALSIPDRSLPPRKRSDRSKLD